MKTGTIKSVDRATGTVEAWIDPIVGDDQDPPEPIRCGYPMARIPPAPLFPAAFSDDLRQCLGSLAPTFPIIHEDFNRVQSVIAAAATVDCDTTWTCSVATAGTISQVGSTIGALGAARLRSTGAASRVVRMSKDAASIVLSAADAFWFSASVDATPGGAGSRALIGLSNATTSILVAADAILSNGVWGITAADGVGAAGVLTADAWGTPSIIDLVAVPGAFASIWVNGHGPATVESPFIPGSGAVGILAYISTGSVATTMTLDIDWVDASAVSGIPLNPRLVGLV